MKKVFMSVILAVMLAANILGCADNSNEKINIIVPNGITLIAVGGLINTQDINIENVEGPDLLISAMTSKSHQVIIAPLNVGAKLYMKGQSSYKLAAMLTYGNLYIVSKKASTLNSLADLEGKQIMAFGQNATPDIILKAALQSQNINCGIEYQSGVSEVIPFFKNDDYKYALVAEPVLSQLQIKQNIDLNIIDLQEILKDEIASIPQAGVFINPDSQNIAMINTFLDNLKDNVVSLNASPEDYANDILPKHKFFENLTKEVIVSAIQSGRVIDYLKAKDNTDIAAGYFGLLNTYNSNILGGEVPDSNFYY